MVGSSSLQAASAPKLGLALNCSREEFVSRLREESLSGRALNPDILESEAMEISSYIAVFSCIHSTSKVDGQAEDITAVKKE